METVTGRVVARGCGREGRMGGASGVSGAVNVLCMILDRWVQVFIHLTNPTELWGTGRDPVSTVGFSQ